MTRCGCGRANSPRRRYCGACGHNLEPACARCGFDNEADDHYCGGCGAELRGAAPASSPIPSRRSAVPVEAPPGALTAAELAELLAPVAPPVPSEVLPGGAIAQDDLDRLFGAVS